MPAPDTGTYIDQPAAEVPAADSATAELWRTTVAPVDAVDHKWPHVMLDAQRWEADPAEPVSLKASQAGFLYTSRFIGHMHFDLGALGVTDTTPNYTAGDAVGPAFSLNPLDAGYQVLLPVIARRVIVDTDDAVPTGLQLVVMNCDPADVGLAADNAAFAVPTGASVEAVIPLTKRAWPAGQHAAFTDPAHLVDAIEVVVGGHEWTTGQLRTTAGGFVIPSGALDLQWWGEWSGS